MEFGPRSLTRALNSKPTPVRFSVLCSSDEPDTTDRETLRHPCHSLTFTTVTKTARNQITLVITGINQKQEPIESEPTIDRVVLWDNHSWNWAAYLLISDRIRVNASALFFICVLKIPLLKILNVCTFFFLFPVSFWSLKRVASSWSDWCHLSCDKVGFILETSTLQLPCFYSEKQNTWGSLIYKFSPSGFFCAVHPSSWLHPRFHQ